MAQLATAVIEKKVECLCVGQMTLVAADTSFQVNRVVAFGQHIIAVIGLKKSGITLTKVFPDVFAGMTNVGKHTHL